MGKKRKLKPEDWPAVRAKLRAAVEASGSTQEQIGVKMGYSKDSARKAVSRLLGTSKHDPRISTVILLCNALQVNLKDIL